MNKLSISNEIGTNIRRIEGKNVFLGPLRSDENAIYAYTKWMNDIEVIKWIGRQNKVVTFTQEEVWAKEEKEEMKLTFNIFAIENNLEYLIGNCDLVLNGSNAKIGILIGEKSFRNKGYGTEVMQLLIQFAFEQCGVHRVELSARAENKRAIKCYQKAGMYICGTKHEDMWYDNHWSDTVCMEILYNDYEK